VKPLNPPFELHHLVEHFFDSFLRRGGGYSPRLITSFYFSFTLNETHLGLGKFLKLAHAARQKPVAPILDALPPRMPEGGN